MTTALSIIVDAYERCNRLSPGETLSADDAAFGLRRLNMVVDELSAQNTFLFKTTLTSSAQSGAITLGAGSWAAIAPGDEIVSATANNLVLSPITMRQYNELYAPNVTGVPTCYAQDGLGTVFLWPVPVGVTIKLQVRNTVANFADQTTDYTMPDGYKSALGASLAVRIAPSIIGNIPPYLISAERQCLSNISRPDPAIIGVGSFTKSRGYFPPRLF